MGESDLILRLVDVCEPGSNVPPHLVLSGQLLFGLLSLAPTALWTSSPVELLPDAVSCLMSFSLRDL